MYECSTHPPASVYVQATEADEDDGSAEEDRQMYVEQLNSTVVRLNK